ncbi:hypothetical protein AK51_35045 [Serratia nematodiphila DZ0503SBS1]|nr:hypothetical protein AK51_35045 [Serratia nematodiphila DZ0503SBS1]
MLATLGVLHTGLMYVLMYGALQKLPTNLIGSLSFIYPIAAMLVDRLALVTGCLCGSCWARRSSCWRRRA